MIARWAWARILWPLLLTGLFLSCCSGSTVIKTDEAAKLSVDADVSKDRHEENYKADNTNASLDETKTTGPVEKDKRSVDEKFGWVPPPPDAPPGSPYQWKPVARHRERTKTKAAGTTIVKSADKATEHKEAAKIDESSKGKVNVDFDDKKTGTTEKKWEWGAGLIKLGVLIAVIGLLILIVYVNPNLLAYPVRFVKWLLVTLKAYFKHDQPPDPKP